jgi:hypothetical protein
MKRQYIPQQSEIVLLCQPVEEVVRTPLPNTPHVDFYQTAKLGHRFHPLLLT